jgi:hypothetical protein
MGFFLVRANDICACNCVAFTPGNVILSLHGLGEHFENPARRQQGWHLRPRAARVSRQTCERRRHRSASTLFRSRGNACTHHGSGSNNGRVSRVELVVAETRLKTIAKIRRAFFARAPKASVAPASNSSSKVIEDAGNQIPGDASCRDRCAS